MSFFFFAVGALSALAKPEHFAGGDMAGNPLAVPLTVAMFVGAGLVARWVENTFMGKHKGGWGLFTWLGLVTLALFGLWIGGRL